jgi:hypothetical protein
MRRRLHPNSHGSKRSLERELAAVKVAVNYLVEDAGMSGQAAPPVPTPASAASSAGSSTGPVPNPPDAGDTTPASSNQGEPVKIGPKAAKKTSAAGTQK